MSNNEITRRRFLQQLGLSGIAITTLPSLARSASSAPQYKSHVWRPLCDQSQQITTVVYGREAITPQVKFQDFPISVPSDMIAIGGGVIAIEGAAGALLTASYPSDNMSTWVVSAKNHGVPQPYNLIGYAIGLKIAGMKREELKKHITVIKTISEVAPHPVASSTLPDGCVLVGGGFNVLWTGYGNLATASYPSDDTIWTASSKDHDQPDPASVISYAIGIDPNLPVGRVSGIVNSYQSEVAPHPTARVALEPGYALTGIGGWVHTEGYGNLLWKLEPLVSDDQSSAVAASKDHFHPDPSFITAYALGIKLDAKRKV